MTGGPAMALLDGGRRLHLQHGPIDLILGADGGPDVRARAFAAAAARFETVLPGLVRELLRHRSGLGPGVAVPDDPTARRMYSAAKPFCAEAFVTPMIAVAGSVADEVLEAMLAAGPLARAYVNNGGDIALHLAPGETFAVAMAGDTGDDLGRVRVEADTGVGGIATSGRGGRSLSLGIADSVTVLAATAATADAAATLIANAVDLPGHPGIARTPADHLDPDSDLGARAVVTAVASLTSSDRARALQAGLACARRLRAEGHILAAALFLQGESAVTGDLFPRPTPTLEIQNA